MSVVRHDEAHGVAGDGRTGAEMVQTPDISLVCPCYNEEEAVSAFVERVVPILESLGLTYELVFVNDGSTDRTLEKLLDLKRTHSFVRVIDLARNFGKEAALTAGIDASRGKAVVPMDADLQDPPELLPEMVGKWREGYEVVLARRVRRDGDAFLKRLTARWFYRLHNAISDIELPENVGDFRLLDRVAVEALKRLPENQRFMKGLFAWVGFRTATVDYERPARAVGRTKFNVWALWKLAVEGITSFSSAPLRVWLYVGVLIACLSFLYGAWIVFKTLAFGRDVPGYASLITVVLFLGGVQLMGLGVLGEYIGRIYQEAKRRPVYVVRREF